MQEVAHSATGYGPARMVPDSAFLRRFTLLVQLLGGKRAAARLIGMTDHQVRRWESGHSRIPLFAAVAFCRVAGVSIGWLVDGQGDVEVQRVVDLARERPRRRAARKVAA